MRIPKVLQGNKSFSPNFKLVLFETLGTNFQQHNAFKTLMEEET